MLIPRIQKREFVSGEQMTTSECLVTPLLSTPFIALLIVTDVEPAELAMYFHLKLPRNLQ
jgi:hypothetical protein